MVISSRLRGPNMFLLNSRCTFQDLGMNLDFFNGKIGVINRIYLIKERVNQTVTTFNLPLRLVVRHLSNTKYGVLEIKRILLNQKDFVERRVN